MENGNLWIPFQMSGSENGYCIPQWRLNDREHEDQLRDSGYPYSLDKQIESLYLFVFL